MKTFLTLASVCVLALLTSFAVVGQDQPSRPPGVAAQDWIPMGDNIGFAVSPRSAAQSSDRLTGYFLARHGNAWKRIDAEGGFRFQPLKK